MVEAARNYKSVSPKCQSRFSPVHVYQAILY